VGHAEKKRGFLTIAIAIAYTRASRVRGGCLKKAIAAAFMLCALDSFLHPELSIDENGYEDGRLPITD